MTPPLDHPNYVVDTSVALKWYVQRGEPDVTKAFKLLEAYGRGQCTLRAPELLLWEVANALTIGHKLHPADLSEALAHLRGLDLDLKSVQWPTLQSAVDIATAADATVYDAYYLALALESNGVLVTADERFLRKARHYPGIVSLTQLQVLD
jgi:predicted nucleic acid-binding protein